MTGAGKCFSQLDTLEVGLSTTVNLIFDSKIVKHHLGSGSYVENNVQVQDVLIDYSGERMSLTARIEEFETTNLFVETENGFFDFVLVYKVWPSKRLFPIGIESAQLQKKVKISSDEQREKLVEVRSVKQRDTLAILAKEVFDKSHVKNPDIGEIVDKMTYYVNGIYIDNEYLFIRVTIHNEGNIKFDLGLEAFYLKEVEGRSTKKTAKAAPIPYDVLYTFNEDVKVVNKKEKLTKVYVFKKFTIDEDRYFSVELWEAEGKGKRNVELKIPGKEILSAKII